MLATRHPRFRRKLRRWIGKLISTTLILFLCLYIYGTKIEPNWIEIVPIELTVPHLDRAFEEFKLVQISDLHASKFMPESRLNRIIQLVNQQQPDAIAITGDIISSNSRFDGEKLQGQLSKLYAKSAIVAVLGNHDHSKKLGLLKSILFQSKIENLDNQVHLVEREGQQLALAGIDDPYWGKPDLKKTIAQLPDRVPAILLVHEPDYIERSAKTHKFVLQLSGHSHGGQIKIPFLAPLVLPRGGQKYYAGLNRVEETVTYTNRGLGMTNLPMRIGSRPEITVFTLHSPG